jgi:hypothetical protein
MRLLSLVLVLCTGLMCLLAGPASAATDELPDLVQYRPYFLGIQTAQVSGKTQFHLGFSSNVQNWGNGPLAIHGSRASTGDKMMADQIITRTDGTTRTVDDVGPMRFVSYPSHNHWHFLKFDTYELRRASDYKLLAPDMKTGFCLGDRFKVDQPGISGRTGPAVFTGGCGWDSPQLLTVDEGISVGYGDDYGAQLEGQYIDITKVPAGDYYLVHRANPKHLIKETNYKNNVASVGVRITWPKGTKQAPKVVKEKICMHSDHCPWKKHQRRGTQWTPVPGQPKIRVSQKPEVVAEQPVPSPSNPGYYCVLEPPRRGA